MAPSKCLEGLFAAYWGLSTRSYGLMPWPSPGPEVVGRTDNRPAGMDLGKPAQQGLTEAHRLHDLAENRLDHLFSEPVRGSPTASFQPLLHACDQASGTP